jgi:hypothetical protein
MDPETSDDTELPEDRAIAIYFWQDERDLEGEGM